jgi:flagellar protein FlaJ
LRESLRVFTPISLVRKFNREIKSKPEKYGDIGKALLGARLPVTLQKLLAISSFYSYLSLITGTALGIFMLYQISPSIILYAFQPTPFYEFVLKNFNTISRYYHLFGIIFGLIAFKLTKYILLSYPFSISHRRKAEIEMYLPHAVNMIYGMAAGGSSAYEIIKTIAESKHLFGELSKEFGVIVEMVDVFKKDMYDAIRYVRDTTPSTKLAGFLDSFVFILQGGGKISDFLKRKSQEYLEEQEVAFGSYIEFMGIVAEIYLSFFVLLPLFLLIVLVAGKLLGIEFFAVYRNIIFVVLPIAAYFMLRLLKSVVLLPKVKAVEVEEKHQTVMANVMDGHRDTFRFSRFKRNLNKIKRAFLHPFEENIYTIQFRIASIHLALVAIVAFLLSYQYLSFETSTVVALSAFLIPLILLIELRERVLRKAEERIPGLFAEIAMLNEAGLGIFECLKILSAADPVLTREISVVRREIEWGVLVPRAFIRMGLRLRSEIMAKIVPAIVKALETAPTIKDAFTIVAKYAESEVRFRNRVRGAMLLYVVIIYMSIGIFLFVAYIIIKSFLAAFAGLEVTGIGGMIVLDLDMIKRVFFEVTLLVAVLSGLIAGSIGEGKITSGIKHSYIFLLATYLVFFHML